MAAACSGVPFSHREKDRIRGEFFGPWRSRASAGANREYVLRAPSGAGALLDLAEGFFHGVEHQQRRGVPRLVIAHGFEDG